jgi:hypothetical protein
LSECAWTSGAFLNRHKETNMLIQVQVRNVFGNDLIYPVNDAARALASLTGRKTLYMEDLKLAKQLEHTIELSSGDACAIATAVAALS